MRITHRIAAVVLLLIGLLAVPTTSRAQTVMNTITNSVAVTDTSTRVFTVSATTNVVANAELFVPLTGEIMCVQAVPVSGTVQVRRGCEGTFAQPFAVTTTLVIIPLNATTGAIGDKDMGGACTRGQGYAAYSPYINRTNAWMWVCIGSVWKGGILKDETLKTLPPFTP